PTPTPITKATKKTNNINITSNPNADVFVAGQKIGKTPLQYYLDPSSPHGIVLKKKGYQDKTDVVSVSASRMVTKNYKLDKAEKVAKKSGGSKWLLYAIVGGGVAYAAMGQKKEGPKTGSLSITISIPN
ncbi:MAG: PEGA domain-containing protein, partial [Candidatus Marinimicrobia bacterium]|nr:PEGA domain-containing protein [Candidatus Neomarinimicrobiota bacterium]